MIPPQRSSSPTTTLYECINNYFKPEHLAEMKCENCSNNSTSLSMKKKGFIKRQAIAKLPECLCIQIQRNSWSDSNYAMIKQTNYVKFPLNIKIDDNNSKSQYSSLIADSNIQTVHSSLLFKNLSTQTTGFSLKQVGLGGLLGGNNTSRSYLKTQSQSQNIDDSLSQSHSSYELKSAVVHYGNANSGHFVAYRKQLQPNQDVSSWLMISDNDIKSVKEANLLNSNVYMLFYDKQTTSINLSQTK
jgi:ubiquitin carboxyl-terminal hydrolase 30